MSQEFFLWDTPIFEGTTLIEASAGTGKTFTITALFLRLILERSIEPKNILVVTYTNAAAEELKLRIRSRLEQAMAVCSGKNEDSAMAAWLANYPQAMGHLREARAHFDECTICTIHSFGKKLLELAAFESAMPFEAEFLADDRNIALQAAQDFWRKEMTQAHPAVADLIIASRWTPEDFLEDYRDWSRYPDTKIFPEPTLEAQLNQRLETLQNSLKDSWNKDSVANRMREVNFKKGKALFKQAEKNRYFDRIDAILRQEPLAQFSRLLQLSPESLKTALMGRSKADKQILEELLDHPFVQACGQLKQFREWLHIHLRSRFIQEVHKNYQAIKELGNFLTFGDLLSRVSDAVFDQKSGHHLVTTVRGLFTAALIDEFQDTDSTQYEVFKKIFKNRPLFLIGDPKQAIYAFRGADVFAYLEAKKDAKKRYTLAKNWRSQSAMVDAVNKCFSSHSKPFLYEGIPFEEVKPGGLADQTPLLGKAGKALEWRFLNPNPSKTGYHAKQAASTLIYQNVANRCIGLLEAGLSIDGESVRPSDFAILVRTNIQAEKMRETLQKAGLPSVVSQSGNIFQTTEMEELHRVMSAVADPLNTTKVHGALATDLWGYGADDIYRLTREEGLLQIIAETLDTYRNLWRRQGFAVMIQKLFSDREVLVRAMGFVDGRRRIVNLQQATELIQKQQGMGQRSPGRLLRWLAVERGRRHPESDDTALRLESDEDAVKIVTIHKSKGLQYNIVFCPFLWDRPVPNQKRPVVVQGKSGPKIFDLGSDQYSYHQKIAERDSLAEIMRLIYVAMTRAKYKCCVFWGPIGTPNALASGLDFLFDESLKTASTDENDEGEFHVQRRPADQLRLVLESLVERNSRSMEIVEVDTEEPLLHWKPEKEVAFAKKPDPCTLRSDQLSTWRITSFTALTSGTPTDGYQEREPDVSNDEPPTGIFAFARGANPGICLHEILENTDFSNLQDSEPMLRDTLDRYGLLQEKAHHHPIDPVEAVRTMVRNVARATVPKLGFSLDSIQYSKRLNEWQFYLDMKTIQPKGLVEIFHCHGSAEIRRDYLPLLEKLNEDQVRGFLTGIVDLIFKKDQRWYVVDWKSNHLGNAAKDYQQQAMWQAMCHHHYVLQYHLYVLALHRFLKSRLVDYRYESHMGGILYVFLRGVAPHTEKGWFIEQPGIAMVQALDRFLGRGG